MDCIECPKASECHSQLLNDIQLIECIRFALEHHYDEQAKEELGIYERRLQERNRVLTGR